MSADSDGPAIRAGGLVKNFGKTRALDGYDLEVAAGTVFGLLGPNGAARRRRCGSPGRCSSPTGVTTRSRASTACATPAQASASATFTPMTNALLQAGRHGVPLLAVQRADRISDHLDERPDLLADRSVNHLRSGVRTTRSARCWCSEAASRLDL